MHLPKINFRKMWAYHWQSIKLNLDSIGRMVDEVEGQPPENIAERDKVTIIAQIESMKESLTKMQDYVEQHKKIPRD